MITLYGYTILVDLALLAIVMVLFVFAVSIYKGASELSIKGKESASDRSKKIIAERKTELTGRLKTLTDGTSLNKVRAELDNLNDEIRKIDKSVQKTVDKANLLTARNMVFIPGSLLIVSIIGSAIAIAIPDLQTIMWALSLFFLAIGLYFTCRNIRAIEFFSNFIDLSTLMEQAIERHTIKTRPIVDLEIWNLRWSPQLEIAHGQTLEVYYDVSLKQGFIAKNARVRFSGTEELDFPDQKIDQPAYDYKNMRKPKRFWQGFKDVNPNEYNQGKFKVKAPDQPGEYNMAYWLQCDEYTADEVLLKIKVI